MSKRLLSLSKNSLEKPVIYDCISRVVDCSASLRSVRHASYLSSQNAVKFVSFLKSTSYRIAQNPLPCAHVHTKDQTTPAMHQRRLHRNRIPASHRSRLVIRLTQGITIIIESSADFPLACDFINTLRAHNSQEGGRPNHLRQIPRPHPPLPPNPTLDAELIA